MTPEERLAQLKIDQYDKEDRKVLEEWRQELFKLRAEESFISHPVTKELVRMIQDQVAFIESTLATNRSLSEIERHELFGQKDAHEIYLSFLNKNPSEAIASLDKEIEEDISGGGY